METESSPKKVTKSRSRSSVTSPIPVVEAVETEAPSENGEKESVPHADSVNNTAENDKDKEKESNNMIVDENDTNKEETDKVTNDKQPQGVKRKLEETKDSPPKENSEANSNDEDSSNAFLGFSTTEQDTNAVKGQINEDKEKNLPKIPDPVPVEEAFGKGKRSRIPNKRYEALGIKTFGKSFLPVGLDHPAKSLKLEEKGSMDESSLPDLSIVKEEKGAESPSLGKLSQRRPSSRSSSAAPSPGTPQAKRQKMSIDMSNPAYLRPFEFGWKRELVWRGTFEHETDRKCDIYYYTPTGKKVRSMREVAEHLTTPELTVDDFTFFKEPLGIIDPDKELIREAVRKGTPGGTPTAKKATPKVTKATLKDSPKVSTPAAEHTEKEKSTPTTTKAGKSPRLSSGFKVKIPGSRLNQSGGGSSKKAKRNQRSSTEGTMEHGMLPPTWSPKKETEKRPTKILTSPMDSKPCQPCSIRCQGVFGLIPTLQCRQCLCLYHTECVGLGVRTDVLQGYVCKNCQLENQEKTNITSGLTPTIAPPPLTPISSLKTNAMPSSTLPKLQRIPRPGEKPQIIPSVSIIPKHVDNTSNNESSQSKTYKISKFSTVPQYIKVLEKNPVAHEPSKNLVGAMTTWFPPSSKIQLYSNNLTLHKNSAESTMQSPRPQSITIMGDRKFLIIPKHSILSVSPTVGAAVNTPSSRVITSPTGDTAPLPTNPDKNGCSLPSTVEPMQVSASLGPENPQTQSSDIPDPSEVNSDSTDITCGENNKEQEQCESENGQQDLNKSPKQESTAATTPTRSSKRASATAKASRASTSTVPTPAPVKVDIESNFMQNYLQNLSYGYQTLLYVFQYLKVQDLLRAGCVCTLWRDIASHSSLWRTVRMKNSQVANWEGFADALKKHNTQFLDLRKMLLPNNSDEVWPLFSKAIARVDTLVKIELCRCPASVVEELAKSNKNLQVINAVTIKCEKLDLSPIDNLVNLQELRLKSTNGFSLTSDLTPLKKLVGLKHLSLTSIKDLNKLNVDVIGDLVNLESLDLGECSDFPDNFGSDIISKLTKLEKLRLEKGQGSCCTFNILEAVSQIPTLEQLELVNFDVKSGFDKALGACTNVKKLLIIPTYISQSATTNHMVLGGVVKLKSTLSHFVWGVTLELLRVTELFVDQCDNPPSKEKKKPTGNGDSIPVLKPVPIMKQEETKSAESSPSKEPPQVEILPLPTLQKLLLNCLPTTRVKILKIPFHATWRQSIVDTVN